ncbi:hypothetical protein [Bacteroides reticulotermitis]|uniref:Uncharacterized protein n=1 Tax=Bacteroides reticulotermitis JCM 10512 TaxID=1445607 RepID=W4ULL7_9BACE|nr:hypothetical protein [Bacteroides reticulotermitis]GAE81861.1 hypothetical protein JCM10512_21 [Bacteroides reticulotermitis JCM 10512]
MKRYIQSIVWMFGMILLVACQAEDLESTNGAAYWVEGVGDGTQVVPTPVHQKLQCILRLFMMNRRIHLQVL